jgi:hypothetical protein
MLLFRGWEKGLSVVRRFTAPATCSFYGGATGMKAMSHSAEKQWFEIRASEFWLCG